MVMSSSKFHFVPTHSRGSDETVPYDVFMSSECVLQDLVDFILSDSNSSGSIKLVGYGYFSYARGVLGDPIPSTYLSRPIDRIYAAGGWGRMTYIVYLQA